MLNFYELPYPSTPSILEPGSQIKPTVFKETVPLLIEKLYGFKDFMVKELKAYDDKNYHLQFFGSNKHSELCPHGYVFKIINSLDSAKPNIFEAQTQMLLYLENKGISCPKPVKNIHGKYFSIEELPQNSDGSGINKNCKKHLVRLLEFQPGRTLNEVPCTKQILFQVGKYIAHLDNLLKGFNSEVYQNHESVWTLKSVPQLTKFLHVIKDPSDYKLFSEVIKEFTKILPDTDNFEKGIIHGDFNEHNIIVSPSSETDSEWNVSAVLDFGDSHCSCYLFDLAITICYMMMISKIVDPVDVGGYVIIGYNTVRPLPKNEFNLLKVCICARLSQSLILGAYSYEQDPGNEYLLDTADVGRKVLHKFWNTPEEEICRRWKNIMCNSSLLLFS